jgi:hypothetical protein
MFNDFKEYGFANCEDYVSILYGTSKKYDASSPILISTWQSIYKNPPEYFEQYDFVIGDEAHQFKAKSLATIPCSSAVSLIAFCKAAASFFLLAISFNFISAPRRFAFREVSLSLSKDVLSVVSSNNLFDFSTLVSQNTKGEDDVLNGIAFKGNNMLVTGKNWSKLYEVKIE